MSLQAKYEQFLNSPTTAALADNASINYITTLTTIHGALPITKHLSAQARQVKKAGERVLSALESADSLCLDVETTLEFVTGGGAFLPGLDDNFLADRTATFPVVHIVNFDADQKIRQIRLYWDQGSLLKQVDVIGARARNWPIRDGKDQARLIESSVSSTDASSRPSTGHGSQNGAAGRLHSNSNVSATRDPHASLSLFQLLPPSEESTHPTTNAPRIAPRASAKPPPREYSELFASEDTAGSPGTALHSPSPTKSVHPGIKPKGGAGKHFQANRLFDENDPGTPTKSPEKLKIDPNKYKHFDFDEALADGVPQPKPGTKRGSRGNAHKATWDFEDFVTPEKVPVKVRGQDARHFSWSDDEGEKSPVRRPIVHHARPDAESRHFEFTDDGTPMGDKPAAPKAGALSNKGMGLYKDHVLGDDSDSPAAGSRNGNQQLKDVTTNVNNENRHRDFSSQFEFTDTSPAMTRDKKVGGEENGKKIKVAGNGMGGRKNLESHWDLYDQSPDRLSENRGIKTANDGMGGRKGGGRSWGFGDESDEEARKAQGFQGRGRKQGVAEPQKDYWDF